MHNSAPASIEVLVPSKDGDVPLRVPGTHQLVCVPTAALAAALVQEYVANQARKPPKPAGELQKLANTALGDPPDSQLLRGWCASDTLLYHADEGELRQLQAEQWLPILRALETQWETPCRFRINHGIAPIDQDAALMARVMAIFFDLSRFHQTAWVALATNFRSMLLAGYMVTNASRLSAEDAFDLAHIETTFPFQVYGIPEEFAATRRATIADLALILRFVDLL